MPGRSLTKPGSQIQYKIIKIRPWKSNPDVTVVLIASLAGEKFRKNAPEFPLLSFSLFGIDVKNNKTAAPSGRNSDSKLSVMQGVFNSNVKFDKLADIVHPTTIDGIIRTELTRIVK
jgi:hypothetical protein